MSGGQLTAGADATGLFEDMSNISGEDMSKISDVEMSLNPNEVDISTIPDASNFPEVVEPSITSTISQFSTMLDAVDISTRPEVVISTKLQVSTR